MKSYLLLRDNRESGPYNFEKISSLGLHPTDLIWIEDESTCWKYPDEIDELKAYIKDEQGFSKRNRPINREQIFVSLPSNFMQERQPELTEEQSIPGSHQEQGLETSYIKTSSDLRENYRISKQRKSIWERKLFQESNHAAVAAVFIGLALGAFVIKKLVDGYVSFTEETAVASPIVERHPLVKEANDNFKNALVTEIVPVFKAAPKKSKSVNVKNQLRIKTNNYKVGVFGGINGLQLTVFNTSGRLVDKAVVALDYMRPNGDVVQSENVLFTSIKPKSSKTISIPGSNRGVKVKYKILKVSSKEYKPDLKQI